MERAGDNGTARGSRPLPPWTSLRMPPSLHSGNEVGGYDPERSPLLYLLTAAPLLAWPHDLTADSAPYWRWLPRLPFVACGVFLGASLWYVARRLCGNTGGFVALTFYCFSPSLIQASALWHTEPEIAAAWGAFGTIFTAIAVAHTLYAPREVVLWNWRRILLLGVSLAIAVGSQFSMIIVAPHGAWISALRCSRAEGGCHCNLGGGVRGWLGAAVRDLLLPRTFFFGEHAPCRVLGSDLARVHFSAGLQAGGDPNCASLPALGVDPAGHSGDLCCMAANSLLRKYCSAAGSWGLCSARDRTSAHGWRRISSGGSSFSFHFRFRSSRGLDGDQHTVR